MAAIRANGPLESSGGEDPNHPPDRYTIKISTSRRQRKGTTDKRLVKEAKEFQAANGYTGYNVLDCNENNGLQIYDYTVEFVR